LDDDDLISTTILKEIEDNKLDFDCLADKYHTYIDPAYIKISYSQGNWLPNTVIHKYEHAIKKCGALNDKLLVQDHAIFWHIYYADKNLVYTTRDNPVYYRILSPTSITSGSFSIGQKIDWNHYLKYLVGYGPWVNINRLFAFYKDLEQLSERFFKEKPSFGKVYWIYNYLKFLKNNRLKSSTKSFTKVSKNATNLSKAYSVSLRNTSTQECSRCLLSTENVKRISFNVEGLCNYCEHYDSIVKSLGTKQERKSWLERKLLEVKKEGKNKKYDCILGVSGGVDSTYLAYWCKQNNLRPLVVHFDNGWNSEKATKNIINICKVLNLELQTIVVDWEEFKDLQLAYLRAGVTDIEALTDHAIYATILKTAHKYKIKYALSGFNDSTEGIMPRGWAFDKRDWNNIKDIYLKYGSGKKLKTFPHVNFYTKLYYYWFLKIETLKILNYIEFNKEEAKETIKKELNWEELGGKHFESLFTKFYQIYILSKKFKIDKRLAHLSNLICSGQITKVEALKEIALPLYDEADILQQKEYVVKKFGISMTEFDNIMLQTPRKHYEFKTEKKLWNRYFKLIGFFKFR
jgi:N-acetyl sugar amidotransferase